MAIHLAITKNRQSGEIQPFFTKAFSKKAAQEELDKRSCNTDVLFVHVMEGQEADQFEAFGRVNENLFRFLGQVGVDVYRHTVDLLEAKGTQK
ncbi:hypothetical protein KW785_01280 [Candidatus Parcubacteria bacterium]|nr:hypothetical protein [Candidatus Parcubacteria bacterium]